MAAPTLAGQSLGSVESIAWTKDANLITIPFPEGDSAATETYDLLGVTKIITISGVFTGDTATVKAAVDVISALIDGDQSTSVSLVTDEVGTLSVKMASFDVTWEIPSNRATYVLKLIEGT